MNNLRLVGIIGAVAGAAYFGTEAKLRGLEAVNLDSARAIEEQKERVAVVEQEAARLESVVKLEMVAVENLRERSVSVEYVETANHVEEAATDPRREGYWPGEKSYFYLSKARLGELTYWPATGTDEITKTAELVLGLDPDEAARANGAYARHREKIRQIELASAVVTNTPTEFENWPGEKTTLFVPGLGRETVEELQREFEEDLTQAIGGDRARLLATRIYESLAYYNRTKDRILTLRREGQKITMMESDGRGNTTSSSYTAASGKQEVPLSVRHLFPNESRPSEP